MDSRKLVLKETLYIFIGELVLTALMLGVFALIGRFDGKVILGGAVGAVLATLNFFFMAVGAMSAADKAEEQDVKGGKSVIRLSYIIRLLVLAGLLFAFYKSGLVDPFALVIPLLFVRPILMLKSFFGKGDKK
ncbi:MAG: ATP synthase subunit I [Clostridia bacterium]|nr:ATP synthase subunit I [Clostridia bacterium]MBR5986708.1 ATP synthase subunit I [Clostridia bacterium]MBR6498840.1 ATP synthase subunit I [Clostridia bacterium]